MTGEEAHLIIVHHLRMEVGDFCRLTGMGRNTVSRWGRGGKVSPCAATLLKLLRLRPELVGLLRGE